MISSEPSNSFVFFVLFSFGTAESRRGVLPILLTFVLQMIAPFSFSQVHHLGNFRPEDLVLPEYRFPKETDKTSFFVFPERPEIWIVTAVEYDAGLVAMIAPLGYTKVFKFEENSREIVLKNLKDQGEIELAKRLFPFVYETPKVPQRLKPLPEGAYPSSEALAKAQVAASSTAKGEEGAQVEQNLRSANASMIETLQRGENLSLDNLYTWHRLHMAASKERWAFRYSGIKSFSSKSGEEGVAFFYIPAEDIIPNLSVLIAQINDLTSHSKPIEFAKVYRDFIVIHPFLNGNGRTARLLLDYALLKNGFAPVSHTPESREVIYTTLEQLTVALFGNSNPNVISKCSVIVSSIHVP